LATPTSAAGYVIKTMFDRSGCLVVGVFVVISEYKNGWYAYLSYSLRAFFLFLNYASSVDADISV